MSASTTTIPTPAGPFTLITDDDGAVLASGWTADIGPLLPQVHERLRPTAIKAAVKGGSAAEAVRRYLDGDLEAVAEVPVTQQSGPFIEHAWKALRAVPSGTTVTYTGLAGLAGRPAAVRAAASACANNAAALFVPCHRVVRSDGGLGGFRWGLPVKQWLIDHEIAPG